MGALTRRCDKAEVVSYRWVIYHRIQDHIGQKIVKWRYEKSEQSNNSSKEWRFQLSVLLHVACRAKCTPVIFYLGTAASMVAQRQGGNVLTVRKDKNLSSEYHYFCYTTFLSTNHEKHFHLRYVYLCHAFDYCPSFPLLLGLCAFSPA